MASSNPSQQPAEVAPVKTSCPQHVLDAIYGGQSKNKQAEYEASLKNWWVAYAERKDDEDEYVADTLLYDKNHLPRTAPEPKW
eukprot:CAMPEP_0177595560 /NCGR_PEP_ID=MMETSP0419_2-20121207/10440_1 /TAXON_ID=582737 /ORGANISM="Tetraselmis sp., Strain GSL018" /LENGTH=82 /DNA_ID=CAMNT_0019087065 /DNA_START=90 /DNA_END=335 /DNA_ORIENTATION=+